MLESTEVRPPAVSSSRRVLALVAAGLLALFFLLAVRVHATSGPLRVDAAASRAVRSPGFSDSVGDVSGARPRSLFRQVAPLGSPLLVVAVSVGLAALARDRRDRPAVVLCLVAPAAAVLLTEVVAKPLVDRHRAGGLTFPSGHVNDMAVVAAVVIILIDRWRGRRVALRWAPLLAALPVGVGLGVVGLGWHYATDAVGGGALGAATAFAVAAALPPPSPRPAPPEPGTG